LIFLDTEWYFCVFLSLTTTVTLSAALCSVYLFNVKISKSAAIVSGMFGIL